MPKPISLANQIKQLPKTPKHKSPVWQGPEKDGITFSLLSRFLCCRERFRILVVEGLQAADTFRATLEFGNLWHLSEEDWARNWTDLRSCTGYAKQLCAKYPHDQEAINHLHNVVKVQFGFYAEHWHGNKDEESRQPLLQEQVFDVPYTLPSGRVVRLRGKWDSVDIAGDKGTPTYGIWLQENKTKSQIDKDKVARQLSFDLQTMIYMIALQEDKRRFHAALIDTAPCPDYVDYAETDLTALSSENLVGVRYNVVRRSQHKSLESLVKKLEDDTKARRLDEWFARWSVIITPDDVVKFRKQCLDPILENLCWWWDDITMTVKPRVQDGLPISRPLSHWRHPFGVYNILDEGGSSDLDSYLETGATAGLHRTENLFPELGG